MSRKDYKDVLAKLDMSKKGQVAIFVIVAIVIVGIILILFLYPKSPLATPSGEFNPNTYLKSCVEKDLQSNIKTLSANAGYANVNGTDKGTVMYQSENIKFLCYTPDFYQTCLVQQPLIKENFEKELSNIFNAKATQCLQSLKTEFQRRGYDVTMKGVNASVSFNPGDILVSYATPMTVTKAGSVRTYNGFDVSLRSNMYDLIMISTSIIDFESSLGDSETTAYMEYYPNLKIEKVKLSDGTKIYTVS
ncbi:MAG: hypothetical protein WCK29_03400, partial [archaeon]